MSQLDQGCVIPCPTAEDITKRGVPPMSPPLAMWEREAQVVELEKGESGLGFSILDYQVRDMPLNLSTNRRDWNRLQTKNISVRLDRSFQILDDKNIHSNMKALKTYKKIVVFTTAVLPFMEPPNPLAFPLLTLSLKYIQFVQYSRVCLQ